eukprot:4555525-Amphidinium_carterae.1
MAMLLHNIQGDQITSTTDYHHVNSRLRQCSTTVQDYYKNVYIDNNYAAGTHGIKKEVLQRKKEGQRHVKRELQLGK